MARPKYSVAELAAGDLVSIRMYLSDRSDDAWTLVHTRLRSAFERLASHPGLGRARVDLPLSELRSFAVGSYIVYYQELRDGVHILRVLHAARDTDALLEQED